MSTLWRRSLLGCVALAAVLLVGPAQAAAGDLDPSFGSGGKVVTDLGTFSFDHASGLARQADGKIVAAGFSTARGTFDFALARYNADGSLDASFGSGGKVLTDIGSSSGDRASGVALQPDGKIVAAGFSDAGGSSDFALVRYNTDGGLDASFGSGGKVLTDIGSSSFDQASGLALQPDGKIVAAGVSDSGESVDFALVRYNTDGGLDASFGSGGKVLTDVGGFDWAMAVALQPDAKIVAAGFSDAGGTNDFALVRYNTDGGLDASFGSGGKVLTDVGNSSGDRASGVALQPDGKIVAAGFSDAGGSSDFALVRYNTNGGLDASFGSGGKVLTDIGSSSFDQASGLTLQPDGKIVAAGRSGSDFALVRYLGDGGPPPQGAADLSLNKVDDRDPVVVGTTFRYVIFIGNNGPDAANAVVVTDQLHRSVVFISASSTQGSCSAAGRIVTCTLGTIPAGRTATIEITVRPTEVGIIRNRATVTAETLDPNTTNNSNAERTTVVAG